MKTQKRNEIKFILNNIPIQTLVYFLKASNGLFSEEFPGRFINSIYFDNLNFDFYKKNIEGFSQRQKIRLRFYGKQNTNLIKNSVLEFKIKENNLGYKIKKDFGEFELNDIFSVNFNNKIEKFTFHFSDYLRPILINNYYRNYFVSRNQNIRFTIDQFIKYDYLNFNKINFNKIIYPKIIVEAKFDPRYNEEALNIINKMPLRAVKNSKYVIGINKFLR